MAPAMGLLNPSSSAFCSHTRSSEYTRRNGLLSQWRAYGNQGGLAIVFDTRKLYDVATDELAVFYYNALSLGDVVYDHDLEAI